jgi:predicted membrane protein
VIALYSKGTSKNGKHAAVLAILNIAAISYVGFQVFQQMHQHIFCPVTNQ